MKPKTFIFVGRSGSGKGTQLELLEKFLAGENKDIGAQSFVMGNIFREFMKGEGYAQERAREIINGGNLMPDFITISLFTKALLEKIQSHEHAYIDGFPRSIPQAQAVIDAMSYFKRESPVIIDIDVSEEEVKKRMLKRGRPDDTEEGIASRFAFYNREVVPAVEFLKEKSGFNYIKIDGERSVEAIHEDLKNHIIAL